MADKRLRIFAGPNGSGKSSILKLLPKNVSLGYYINADDIERSLVNNQALDFGQYGIKCTTEQLHQYFTDSLFVSEKSTLAALTSLYFVEDNKLKVNSPSANVTPKYAAAIIAGFIREENLKAGNSFSFETVMSHVDKIDLIRKANNLGYKVYLYYVCLDDFEQNIQRVATRVKEGGHNVPVDKIKKRYNASLSLLYPVLFFCYKSYLFDNSKATKLIARINRDSNIEILVEEKQLPPWFIQYIINKIGK